MAEKLTQHRLLELLEYHPSTGEFFWRVRRGSARPGDEAGCQDSIGYKVIRVFGKNRKAHRLAWLYCNGYLPEKFVDHIDRDRTNNRISNLREVDNQCNIRNSKNRKNASGVKGVSFSNYQGKWMASVMVNQKTIHLGFSDDKTEAVALRLAGEQSLGWAGCDSSSPALKYMRKYLEKGA